MQRPALNRLNDQGWKAKMEFRLRDVSVGARLAFLLALRCALCQIWLFGGRNRDLTALV